MQEVSECTWDEEVTTSHLFDAAGLIMNRVNDSLHQVVDSGLLEAAGLRGNELRPRWLVPAEPTVCAQQFCWCVFIAIQAVMRNMVLCVSERPANTVATARPQLGAPRDASACMHPGGWRLHLSSCG